MFNTRTEQLWSPEEVWHIFGEILGIDSTINNFNEFKN